MRSIVNPVRNLPSFSNVFASCKISNGVNCTILGVALAYGLPARRTAGLGPHVVEPVEASAQGRTGREVNPVRNLPSFSNLFASCPATGACKISNGVNSESHLPRTKPIAFKVPTLWEYTAPLIAPEKRDSNPSPVRNRQAPVAGQADDSSVQEQQISNRASPVRNLPSFSNLFASCKISNGASRAQKDPTVVFYGGKWHVFVTVKLPGRSAIEYCSFKKWEEANRSQPR